MKKHLFLSLFMALFSSIQAQQSLDSLRLVLPVSSGKRNDLSKISFGDQNKLILICEFGQVQIWNAKIGKLLNNFKIDNNDIISARLTKDNIHVLFSTEVESFLCEIYSGKNILKMEGGNAVFSEDEKSIYTIKENKIFVWDHFKGTKNKMIVLDDLTQENLCYNHLASKIAYINKTNELLNIVNLPSGEIEFSAKIIEKDFTNVSELQFSADDSKILYKQEKTLLNRGIEYVGKINVFDLKKGSLILSISSNSSKPVYYDKISFNADGSQVLMSVNKAEIQIWDCISGKCIRKITPQKKSFFKWNTLSTLAFTQDGQFILTSANGFCRIYNSNTGKLINDFPMPMGSGYGITNQSCISSDNKFLVIQADLNYEFWDVSNGKLINELQYDKMLNVEFGDVSWKNKFLWSQLYKNGFHHVRLFDLDNFSLVKSFINPTSSLATDINFSNDDKLFIQSFEVFGLKKYTRDMVVNVFDIENNRETFIQTGLGSGEPHAVVFDENRKILTWTSGFLSTKEIKVWDREGGDEIQSFNSKVSIDDLKISPNNLTVAYFSLSDSIIRISDLTNFDVVKTIYLKELIKNIEFNNDGQFLLVQGETKTQIWNLEDLKILNETKNALNNYKILEKYNFRVKKQFSIENGISILWSQNVIKRKIELYNLENNNWLVKLPNSPYYMCSKDASKMLHYVTPSLKVIGFEQLDPVYNRPDIVLDSIGKYFDNEDQGKIEEYRKAWEKRIEYLGLDKNMLGKGEISVPQAELQVAEETISNDGKIQVNVVASDPKYALKRFNVFVNEVPLYGSSGVSIAHMNKQNWDTTLSVPLSIGDNKIQVSVMNELGLESFKYPSYVSYAPKMEQSIKGKTYFIGIGVDKFRDTCFNLNYCVKDVTDLSKAFGKGQGNTETILLTNKMVTRENILKLKSTLQKTTVNDKVIISCNSHGLLDEKKRFYLATHDIDFEHPSERGISYQELESLLDSIPARQKLLLLDACNSGENEIGQEAVLANKPKTKCEQEVGGRSVGRANVKKNNEDFMKMNELFVNVRNNTGSVIISAAGGQQSALEGEGVQVDGKGISNGAFTYCVLEYLKQHEGDAKALTVVQLKQYVEKRVEEITKGQQKPTSRQETMEIDWGLR